jgi:nuclear transport factor 2 (NTF2) superfamily protein
MSKKWTRELELDLLVNFYDLTIDEACVRYGASYKAIAGRLERLFDAETEEGISLLLEAAEEVKRRKGLLPTSEPKTKKEQRIMRKISKLQNKLRKLQGDEE